MSAPDHERPGGANFFPASFAACLALSRAQHAVVENLDDGILAQAHDFAVRRLDEGLAFPALRLCKAMVFMEGPEGEEAGGLQLNFSTNLHGRQQVVGARVLAYTPGDPFVHETEPFTLSQAEDVARSVRCLAVAASCVKGMDVTPDLTGVVGVISIPVFRTDY